MGESPFPPYVYLEVICSEGEGETHDETEGVLVTLGMGLVESFQAQGMGGPRHPVLHTCHHVRIQVSVVRKVIDSIILGFNHPKICIMVNLLISSGRGRIPLFQRFLHQRRRGNS